MLENMAVVDTHVSYKLSSFPYLVRLNVTKSQGITRRRMPCFKFDWDLKLYLGEDLGITELVICFTGYDRWFKLWSPTLLLPKLRRVLIADVPSSGDISCPRLLIEAAPCLESLHIHITRWEEEPCDDIFCQHPEFCHNQLKELVIIGFEGTKRQIYFVSFVMKVSAALQLVSLYKSGHVQDRGHWDWNMVTQQYQWDNEEKAKILNRIADSVPFSAAPIQVVLE
uniref:FBD domain-containing protein n=1 Tax=Arundo donax TaxID=35708 RepID=A0A0A9HMH0_ARUDO